MNTAFRNFSAYLGLTLLLLYLVYLVAEYGFDWGLPIPLNLFGAIALLISVFLSRQHRISIETEQPEELINSSGFQLSNTFIYSIGAFGVLLMLTSTVYFLIPVPDFYRHLPDIVSNMTFFRLVSLELFSALLYIVIGFLTKTFQTERYHSVFITVFFGALAGITLSLAAASIVSLLFSLASGGQTLGERVLVFFFLSIFYGIGLTGIPSGIIGLLTGVVVGFFMYRFHGNLSDNKAVIIGLLSSLSLTVLIFLILLLMMEYSLLFGLLLFGLIYIFASCAISVLVYRNYFRITPEPL